MHDSSDDAQAAFGLREIGACNITISIEYARLGPWWHAQDVTRTDSMPVAMVLEDFTGIAPPTQKVNIPTCLNSSTSIWRKTGRTPSNGKRLDYKSLNREILNFHPENSAGMNPAGVPQRAD